MASRHSLAHVLIAACACDVWLVAEKQGVVAVLSEFREQWEREAEAFSAGTCGSL